MKYLFIALTAFSLLQLTACKETDSALNAANNERMKDSVFRAHPEIRYFGIEIEESSKVEITCGSEALFNADAAKQEEIAKYLADVTYHFHNEHNYLSEGKVKFTAAQDHMPTESDPVKEVDMHLKEVVKSHEK